jgi:cell division transport system permease protein
MFTQLRRILSTTFKDLVRNKSITLSSTAVMSLVFLVFTIFVGFAYSAIKFLNYVETREHLEVFFNTDVSEGKISEIKQVLENTGKTAYVEYTTQEQAAEFLRERHSDNPLILGAINSESLPASLAIRAKKIDYVPELNSILETQDPTGELIYKIGYNEDTTNLLKDLLFWVKLAGAILFVLLVIVIFLVSLITVEISIAARGEEISIMQLVGGARWYIRAPFIFEGAIYGIVGAFIAATIFVGSGLIFHLVKDQSPTLSFLSNFFSDLNLPKISLPLVLGIYVAEMLFGGLVGSINSMIAVLRRLK